MGSGVVNENSYRGLDLACIRPKPCSYYVCYLSLAGALPSASLSRPVIRQNMRFSLEMCWLERWDLFDSHCLLPLQAVEYR